MYSEDGSDVGDINHGDDASSDDESKNQLNGELHDDAADAADDSPPPGRAESEDDKDSSSEEGEKEEQFVVEEIQGHKKTKKGEVEYYIKWVGYPKSENTWEPEAHLLP